MALKRSPVVWSQAPADTEGRPANYAGSEEMLRRILEEYPVPPPPQTGLDLVLHDPALYARRTAYDMQIVIDRVGTDITVADLGGGFGLFALGFAQLGARSILIDDFEWHRSSHIGRALFELFARYGVEVVDSDLLADDPFPAADAITTFHTIEHLHNSPKAMLHRVMDALRPGGVFVLGVPNATNLRKRISAPFGKVKWSTMADWYEQAVFRGHVREPDVHDLRYIAHDMGLERVAIHGRNFIGMRSRNRVIRAVAIGSDPVLRHAPSLCGDIYLVGQKPGAD